MKCNPKQYLTQSTRRKNSYANSWSIIMSNAFEGDFENVYDDENDRFFEERPMYQELLTDKESISNIIIDYSNYEQTNPGSLYNRSLSDCFNGVLNYIYCCSSYTYNISELNFFYSGSKERKNLKMMQKSQSTQQQDQYDIINIFNYDDAFNEFKIDNHKNAFFAIEFKRIQINPKSYSIRSGLIYNANSRLISFKFEGYDSSLKQWDTLDERENGNELNQPGGYMMYFTRQTNKSYSIFRIQQTNSNQNDIWGFTISAFDIHGDISYKTDFQDNYNLGISKNEFELDFENDNLLLNANQIQYNSCI